MTDDRAVRALEDVVAVETLAPGLVRVVTWRDAYTVDARGDGCRCPDHEYHDVPVCKHEYAALLADGERYPSPYVTDTGGQRIMTDGGETVREWRVVDHTNDDNIQFADSKSDAEAKAETAREFGSTDVSIVPPGEPLPGENDEDVEIVEHDEVDPEPATTTADAASHELPERDVGTDPLEWLPPEFVDNIEGSMAVNRKGYEVLAHFYDVDVTADLEVPPEDTDHEYCRVKATATTAEGRVCEAYGSAHVDRGDDKTLLLELAGTRARKRSLSIATGTGAVAVAELRNETERELEASD